MSVTQDTIFLMFLCCCCRTRNEDFKIKFLFGNYDTDQKLHFIEPFSSVPHDHTDRSFTILLHLLEL